MANSLIEVNIVTYGIFIISLPLFGLVSSAAVTLIWHLEELNREQFKNVPNFLPSVSVATGLEPQKYIWRITIALAALPIMGNAFLCYQYLYQRNPAVVRGFWFTWWNRTNSALHLIENAALLLLVFVSHRENLDVHKAAFAVFAMSSIMYMISTCLLYQYTSSTPMTHEEAVSLKWKRILFFINISSMVSTVCFYFRDYWYHEPYVYTLFALSEYVVVLSNIAFHSTLAYDVKGAFLTIAFKPVMHKTKFKGAKEETDAQTKCEQNSKYEKQEISERKAKRRGSRLECGMRG